MKSIDTKRAIPAVALLLLAGMARSEPPALVMASQKQAPQAMQATRVAATTVQQPKARTLPFAEARAVPDSTLQGIAGREDVSQTVIARNASTVANNSVGDHTTTGTITFGGQSFEGLHGLSVLSANTGNNVSINASMNVNVAIRQ